MRTFPLGHSHDSMLCGPPFFLFSYSLAETFQSGILLYAKQKIKGDQGHLTRPGSHQRRGVGSFL